MDNYLLKVINLRELFDLIRKGLNFISLDRAIDSKTINKKGQSYRYKLFITGGGICMDMDRDVERCFLWFLQKSTPKDC